MTPFPHSVEVGAPVSEAAAAMEEHEIRHLPVTDQGTLVGVVSEREVGLVRERQRGSAAPDPPVGEVCLREALIVDLGEPLDDVLLQMADGHFDAALVVRRTRLAGIFTVTDACRGYGDLLRERIRPGGGGDAA